MKRKQQLKAYAELGLNILSMLAIAFVFAAVILGLRVARAM